MRRNWSVTATIIATLFVLLANVSGWSDCDLDYRAGCYSYQTASCIPRGSSVSISCSCEQQCTDGTYMGGRYVAASERRNEGGTWRCYYRRCRTACQADSLTCLQNGGLWVNTGASSCDGKSCKLSSCTPSDTSWLKTSIAACQDIQGSNNYALVDTNDVCEHRGHCCALDSLIEGDSCKWRCESQDSLCALNKGNFSYAIVADTAVSGSDTAYTGLCYNNCFMYASRDSLTGLVTGNVTAVNNTSMAAGTYYPDGFKGIRSDYAGIYTYDFLSDETYEWADSLLSAPCSVGMYRGIKNGKYVYWKSGQPVPEGVTNVVKVK